MSAELPSPNSHYADALEALNHCLLWLVQVLALQCVYFFYSSWTYLPGILVFMKNFLTEIQVVDHVDEDVEQVEHNSP